jgi:hypothetical protein
MRLHTKQAIARERSVTCRTVDNWRDAGLLPAPLKLGTSKQARVRWTDRSLAILDANLKTLGGAA